MSNPLPDKEALCTFIKSITKSPSDSRDKWSGERCMVDLLELVKRFYYDPITDGSNSIKKSFRLSCSQFLQEKYSRPIYGSQMESSAKILIIKSGLFLIRRILKIHIYY